MTRPLDTSHTKILPLSVDAELRRSFQLLEILDRFAEETALAHAARTYSDIAFVTAAIDQMHFRGRPDMTSDMVLLARVNYVGTRSLEVGIRIEQPGPKPLHYVSCYFTMVANHELPPLDYEDELERRRRGRALVRKNAYRDDAVPTIEPPSPAEQSLLAELHMAQEGAGFDGLLVCNLTNREYDRAETPPAASSPAKIVGGYVIHRAYVHATMCAELVAPDRPVVVSINRVNFHQPVNVGDKLHFSSRVTYTGNTSICVEVDIVRESRDRRTAALCNTCTFTFKNVDDALGARPVPNVYPTTYAEDVRYLAAHRRRLRRLAGSSL
ncbi:MAG TPA: hotdog domain-containing protein [Candidatus Baltobacteraceae bacterium]|nr:hotdog domain-containing protein [Candidatus Baltobacteraceae bacterium]